MKNSTRPPSPLILSQDYEEYIHLNTKTGLPDIADLFIDNSWHTITNQPWLYQLDFERGY